MNVFSDINLNGLEHVAARILELAEERNIVFLTGDLGAGKTTLVKEVCRQKGCGDEHSSPTYSIINEYITPDGERIFHMDLYRLRSLEEAHDFGIEEYIYGKDLCLIEWPDLVEKIVETPLRVAISMGNDPSLRTITIT